LVAQCCAEKLYLKSSAIDGNIYGKVGIGKAKLDKAIKSKANAAFCR